MNCDANNVYVYVGLAIAIVFTVYVAFKLINKNNRIEGLENNTTIQEMVTKIKKESELLEDTLLIDKHRADYEDLFLALEDYSNLAIIQMLSTFANDQKETIIERINHMNTLKTTLNDVMEFIDRKKKASF